MGYSHSDAILSDRLCVTEYVYMQTSRLYIMLAQNTQFYTALCEHFHVQIPMPGYLCTDRDCGLYHVILQ